MLATELQRDLNSIGLPVRISVSESKTKYCIVYFMPNKYKIFTILKTENNFIHKIVNHIKENI